MILSKPYQKEQRIYLHHFQRALYTMRWHRGQLTEEEVWTSWSRTTYCNDKRAKLIKSKIHLYYDEALWLHIFSQFITEADWNEVQFASYRVVAMSNVQLTLLFLPCPRLMSIHVSSLFISAGDRKTSCIRLLIVIVFKNANPSMSI